MATDFTIILEDRPGELARVGEALGNAGVTIEADARRTRAGATYRRRAGAGHSAEEQALLSFLDRYFPDRRHRRVRPPRERREDLMAA